MTTPEKVYLGDGVYAEEKRGMILLTTERPGGMGREVHTIYLEADVFVKLRAFAWGVWPNLKDTTP